MKKRTRLGWAQLRLKETKVKLADAERELNYLRECATMPCAVKFEVIRTKPDVDAPKSVQFKETEIIDMVAGDMLTFKGTKPNRVPVIFTMGILGEFEADNMKVTRIS